MNFAQFYESFVIEEGFQSHRNIKHKVMAAANKAVKTLIHGVKDIEDRYINSIENMLTTKRELAEMWGDVEPITEEQHKAVENALNTVKQKKPTLRTLYYYYILFCATFGENRGHAGSYMHVLDVSDVPVFQQQDKEDSGFIVNNITLTVSKKPEGRKGFWQYDNKRLCVVLPMATFRNYSSDKWARSYGQYISLCNRLMDEKSFTDFVQYLEKDIKATLSHEFTHTWQTWKQEEGKKERNAVPAKISELIKQIIPYGHYIDKFGGYVLSSDETEARRSEAQQYFKSSGKSYVDCFAKALTYNGNSYNQLKSLWFKDRNTFGEILIKYFMYVVLPRDKTFQNDLKKHTKIRKGTETYTGTYSTYMQDLEEFKTVFKADKIETAFKNIKKYYELVSKNFSKIKGAEILSSFQSHKDEIPSNNFWAFWSDNETVQKYAFEPVEKQLSEL